MSKLICRSLSLRTGSRNFSTSIARPISLQLERNDPEEVADVVPPYPYGPAQWYKQSDKGLYGGQRLRFGNNVGEKFQTKSRRMFKPNVTNKRLWSTALGRWVQVRVTTRVLRTIDKVGGLDEYLLGEKEARIKELGMSGWWLRWAIMRTPLIRARYAREREELGLSSLSEELDRLAIVETDASSDAAALGTLQTVGSDGVSKVIKPEDEHMNGTTLSDTVQDGRANATELELLTTDDAFVVENPPHLPKLEFRVNNNQRMIMTSQGWRLYQGDKKEIARKAKVKLSKELLPHVASHMSLVEARLPKNVDLVAEDIRGKSRKAFKALTQMPVTEKEKAAALVRTKHHFRQRWTEAVAGIYQQIKFERTKKGKKAARNLRIRKSRKRGVVRSRSMAAPSQALGGKGIDDLSGAISEQPTDLSTGDSLQKES